MNRLQLMLKKIFLIVKTKLAIRRFDKDYPEYKKGARFPRDVKEQG